MNVSATGGRTIVQTTAESWHKLPLDADGLAHQADLLARWASLLASGPPMLAADPEPSSFALALQCAAPVPRAETAARQPRARLRRVSDVASPLELDLVEIAEAMATGEISSLEVTRASIDRFEAIQGATNLAVRIDAEKAIDAAKKADRARSEGTIQGALNGVPLAHKDLLHMRGEPSACGGAALPAAMAERDATVLERLAGGGALNLARLHMTEYAFDPRGLNAHTGDCRNPFDLERIPGGSSSGSGVATAARAVYGALGSDTGGSIRLPAALCGVTGLKPTYGRVSRAGAMALSFSNDHLGPLARSARDCARILSAIAGPDPFDPTASARPAEDYEVRLDEGMEGLRIGVPERFFRDALPATHSGPIDTSLSVLESLGAHLVRVPDYDYDRLNAFGSLITRCEAIVAHTDVLRARPDGYSPVIRRRFYEGLGVPAAIYLQALCARAGELKMFIDEIMADVDVLHAPVVGIETPTITEASDEATGSAAIAAELTRMTRPFNYLGLPVLSLPCGFVTSATGTRMPIGFQLIGRPFDEARLLAAGATYQTRTDWHRVIPNLPELTVG